MSETFKGPALPLVLAIVTVLFMFGEFFLINESIANVAILIRGWTLIISGFFTLVGYFTLLRHHSKVIIKRDKDLPWSAIIIATSIIYIAVGLLFGTNSSLYANIYTAVPGAVRTTMWALMGAMMLAGAYRGFMIKSWEGVVFLSSAIILMFYRAPLGPVIWSGFPIIGEWLVGVVQRTTSRAIVISASVGIIVTGLRMLLGEESGFLKRTGD